VILAEASGAVRQNWLHYLCEMLGLAGFLLVAGAAVSVFFAEIGITFAMMLWALRSTNSKRFALYPGFLAGALLAKAVYRWPERTKRVIFAKLYHPKNDQRCIFINCGYKQMS
jgi:hypothetical protein